MSGKPDPLLLLRPKNLLNQSNGSMSLPSDELNTISPITNSGLFYLKLSDLIGSSVIVYEQN